MAGNALPTYTGLAPQCSGLTQAAAAAAAAASGGTVDATCPAAPQLACAQSQLRPDSQTLQAGSVVAWAAGASNSTSVAWQAPSGVTAAGRPARVQLSLEGGTAPAFTYGPVFPPDLRTGSAFGLQFALDKPALLIYAGAGSVDGDVKDRCRVLCWALHGSPCWEAHHLEARRSAHPTHPIHPLTGSAFAAHPAVFRPMPIDANGAPQAPVLIATGRVPVFDAASNATASNITACPWAPGGAMQPQSQVGLCEDKAGMHACCFVVDGPASMPAHFSSPKSHLLPTCAVLRDLRGPGQVWPHGWVSVPHT